MHMPINPNKLSIFEAKLDTGTLISFFAKDEDGAKAFLKLHGHKATKIKKTDREK